MTAAEAVRKALGRTRVTPGQFDRLVRQVERETKRQLGELPPSRAQQRRLKQIAEGRLKP